MDALPTRSQILESVQHYCSEAIGLSPVEVLPDYDLRDDLGMSPVELGEVMSRLQEHYKFVIPKEHLKEIVTEFTTVSSLVDYVEEELEL